jgi:hypothetical protein
MLACGYARFGHPKKIAITKTVQRPPLFIMESPLFTKFSPH